MDVGVKRKDELKDWLSKDPIAGARRRLCSAGVPEDELNSITRRATEEVESAVHFARSSPYPAPEAIADHVFAAARTVEHA